MAAFIAFTTLAGDRPVLVNVDLVKRVTPVGGGCRLHFVEGHQEDTTDIREPFTEVQLMLPGPRDYHA